MLAIKKRCSKSSHAKLDIIQHVRETRYVIAVKPKLIFGML